MATYKSCKTLRHHTPAADDPCEAKRLVSFLIDCSRTRGEFRTAYETFEFWTKNLQPDYGDARRFAEGIRDLFINDEYGHRVGVRQVNHRVTVRHIPLTEHEADDAIRTVQFSTP